jgi:antitoxin (DNA-binding transcriptional repressor) of toxin-antitoxin stability system
MVMSATETLSVTEFKAKCLDLFNRLSNGRLTRVEVTRRGRTVAIVNSPPSRSEEARALHGSMAGMTRAAPDYDPAAPVLDEPFDADLGVLHR